MTWTEPAEHGLTTVPDVYPHQIITPDHPAWHRRHDPEVWGSLAAPSVHHPLFDTEAEPEHWREGRTHAFWTDLRHIDPDTHVRAEQGMRRALAGSRIAVAASTPALHQILADGEVRSAFAVGGTRATSMPVKEYLDNHRRYGEREHFGYPFDHPDHARPIYGYLTHDPVHEDSAAGYGAHTLVFSRPALAHRTTWTSGDTLNYQNDLRPSSLVAPRLRSIIPGMIDSEWTAEPGGDRGVHRLIADHNSRPSYIEAQIHGGAPLRHLHYAILRSSSTNGVEELGKQFTARGIPWVHVHGIGQRARVQQFHPVRVFSRAGAGASAWDNGDGYIHQGVLMSIHGAVTTGALNAGFDPQVRWHQGDHRYIIELAESGARGLPMGQVADLEFGMLYAPVPVDSILARGYWQRLQHPVDAEDVLALVRPA